jgi:hypothetical protein
MAHGDAIRQVQGYMGFPETDQASDHILLEAGGVFYVYWSENQSSRLPGGTSFNNTTYAQFQLSRSHPTANKVQPRAWGSLACVYLGLPAS